MNSAARRLADFATRTASWLALGLAASGAAQAGESEQIHAPTAREAAGFGYAAASSGGWLVVGAPGEDEDAGAVYIYDCSTLPCAAPLRLLAPERDDEAEFGAAIAIAPDRLVIGSPGDGHGVVDVYERMGAAWKHDARLAAFDGDGNDRFGHAIALDGDRLLVGAPRAGLSRGAVYAFERDTMQWATATRLLPSASAPGDRFGHAIAAHGGRALIASPMRDMDGAGPGFAHGAVFSFDYGGSWAENQVMTAPAADSGTRFGWSLSINATLAAIGAPGSDLGRGAIRIFSRPASSWNETDTLTLPGASPGDRLGWQVRDDGGDVLAGLPLAGQSPGASCGRFVRFVDTLPGFAPQWLRVRMPAVASLAGWTVLRQGSALLAGAPSLSASSVAGAGAVLRFDLELSLMHDGFESGAPDCGIPPV